MCREPLNRVASNNYAYCACYNNADVVNVAAWGYGAGWAGQAELSELRNQPQATHHATGDVYTAKVAKVPAPSTIMS